MPKLPSVSPQKLARALGKAGFILERTTESHSIYYHPQTHRKAVVPIHSKDIPNGTLCKLLKEAGISKEELTGSAIGRSTFGSCRYYTTLVRKSS